MSPVALVCLSLGRDLPALSLFEIREKSWEIEKALGAHPLAAGRPDSQVRGTDSAFLSVETGLSKRPLQVSRAALRPPSAVSVPVRRARTPDRRTDCLDSREEACVVPTRPPVFITSQSRTPGSKRYSGDSEERPSNSGLFMMKRASSEREPGLFSDGARNLRCPSNTWILGSTISRVNGFFARCGRRCTRAGPER